MKTIQRIILPSLMMALSACTQNSSSNQSGTDSVIPNRTVSTISQPTQISEPDWKVLENFLLNSSYPTQTKISAAKAYIESLRLKNNLTSEQVKEQISRIFQIPSDESLIAALPTIQSRVAEVRKEEARAMGIPYQDDEYPVKKLDFLSSSKDVQNLRTNNMVREMAIEAAQRKVLSQTYFVFKSFDDEARKNADGLLAYVSQVQGQDIESKVKWLATLDEDTARVEALNYAAQIVKTVQGPSDEEKKGMVGYVAEQIEQAAKDPKSFENSLRLKVQDPALQKAAGKLATLANFMATHAKNKASQLKDIHDQLQNFSKDGLVKIDLTQLTGNPNFKHDVEKFGKDVAVYVDAGQQMVDLARIMGVDPQLCNKVQKGISIADQGVQIAQAIASPNPITVISAVGSVLGVTGPSVENAAEKQMQAKLDMMIDLQMRTLDELEKTRKDIHQLMQETAKTQIMIGQLSGQIAQESQVLYDKLTAIEEAVDSNRQLEMSALRSNGMYCIGLNVQNKSIASILSKSTRSMDSSLTKCLEAVGSLQINQRETLAPYRTFSQENGKAMLFGMVSKALRDDTLGGLYSHFSLNPVESLFQFQNYGTNNSFTMRQRGSDIYYSFIKAKHTILPDDLLDSEYINKFVGSVIHLSPYIAAFNGAPAGNLEALVERDPSSSEDFVEQIEKLMDLVNIHIAQLSQMTGIYSPSLSSKELAQLNSMEVPSASSQPQDVIKPEIKALSSFLSHPMSEKARGNFLRAQLSREVMDKFHNLSAYTFMLRLDPEKAGALLKKNLDPAWNITVKDSKFYATVAGQQVPMPTGEELERATIEFPGEMKVMLALRENLLDLLTEMRTNGIAQADVRRLLMKDLLKRALQ